MICFYNVADDKAIYISLPFFFIHQQANVVFASSAIWFEWYISYQVTQYLNNFKVMLLLLLSRLQTDFWSSGEWSH